MKRIITALAALSAAFVTISAQAPDAFRTFPASAPEVRYVGRTLTAADGSVTYNWSGVYCEFAFTGGYCAVEASDSGKDLFNLFIDGVQTSVIGFAAADTTVVLFNANSCGQHTARIQKRTEGNQGRVTLKKIVLAENGSLAAAPLPAEKRGILFIGNSLTCGYGVEAEAGERFSSATENCGKAFGCIIARHFNADYQLISHSGKGAARNYGDKRRTSELTMRELFGRTFDDGDERWDFASDGFKPDVAVIYLGTNDFSTKPWPRYKDYRNAIFDIAGQVRSAYGDIPILCVATYITDPALEYTRKIVKEGNAAGGPTGNLHLAAIFDDYCDRSSEMGADGHPDETGQQKTAMLLIPYISTLTGWTINPE